ncbi:trypsin inhibitor ClTI-1-like [Amblyraja radiata]|uniref:trypsin inhibitor ClTI-1-like n=1 Tax=Amblyraja radiata TaxID=386614 RepID=UPI0014041E9D|nr:trypsin inhibitor ClTI-1-like [Amblyraja radiata]
MKRTKYLFMATLVVLIFIGISKATIIFEETEQPACDQYSLPACSRHYAPVCGTNGITYSNECLMCVEIKQRKTNIRITKRDEC